MKSFARFLPTVACAVLIALGVLAGNWQRGRAEHKLALQAQLDEARQRPPIRIGAQRVDATTLEYHAAVARGTWLADQTVLVDNKVHNGVAGYFVATPLRLDGADLCVLVVRGWVAGQPNRRVPTIRTLTGVVELTGEVRAPNPRAFELSQSGPQGMVWQNLTVDRYAAATGLAMQPLLLYQTSDSGDGLVRAWDRPDLGIAMHRGYAFQWYALALAAVVFLVYFTYHQRRHKADS